MRFCCNNGYWMLRYAYYTACLVAFVLQQMLLDAALCVRTVLVASGAGIYSAVRAVQDNFGV